ncbi:hypothetical protein GCM10010193_57630 [Kitasatospora atroaurantiaca]|uniref:Uncharacterized protein n=1 Tax=Kitasatospora atroaurantiaca TaxID=285545 RepID=A0A561EN10_9ACTN|nr:hypothetical protein [Kitasatospora atroaurantiaca]TWE17008.1 hypothetical protein FB465_2005 [Kitasatospora atroaurantiaca]
MVELDAGRITALAAEPPNVLRRGGCGGVGVRKQAEQVLAALAIAVVGEVDSEERVEAP